VGEEINKLKHKTMGERVTHKKEKKKPKKEKGGK